ncbi:SWI/SNF complex subunit SWI3C [Camellia lanceoleosa]|uniref:SWI/SNF complex subunit SWI3C n=1 Tax=Camellia lanceoleosa TaxID=1840588 RepID=A0ACC0FAX4_9ERIC|nr:SWI/SNF complex subunit SWI3C [Camellia lanceoleosa]
MIASSSEDPQSGPTNSAPIARESEVLSDEGVRISHFPPMIKHIVNRPHSSVLVIVALEKAIQCEEGKNLQNDVVLENESHGQLQALSAMPVDSPASTDDQGSSSTAAYVITPPPVMEGRGVVKRFGANGVHVVPMHADWFSPIVHRLERQVVPHFFSGKSAEHRPEKYMECCNWIVAKYMENLEMRLSVDDFRELVVGIDIDDLTRIVRFLDHWGIINYCAFSPNCEHRSDGSYLKEDSNGEVHVPSAALKSINSLIRFDKPKNRHKAADVYPSLSCHDGEESDLDSRIREQLSENQCNCCSCPLPIVYYQSQKEIRSKLTPILGDNKVPLDVIAFTAISLALVCVGSCNEEVAQAIIFALMDRSESELGEPLTRLLPLGLGLLYLGKQESVEATAKVSKTFNEKIRKYCDMTLLSCAYAGTRNVLKVQHLLGQCAQHLEKGETHQGPAVLGIAMVAMAEELGLEMAIRSLEHLLRSLCGIVALLHACLDMKAIILGKYHYVLYFLILAMQPRMLLTVDENLKPLLVPVRTPLKLDLLSTEARISGKEYKERVVNNLKILIVHYSGHQFLFKSSSIICKVILSSSPNPSPISAANNGSDSSGVSSTAGSSCSGGAGSVLLSRPTIMTHLESERDPARFCQTPTWELSGSSLRQVRDGDGDLQHFEASCSTPTTILSTMLGTCRRWIG